MRVLEHSARSHDLDVCTFLTGAVEPFQARDLAVVPKRGTDKRQPNSAASLNVSLKRLA